MIIIRCIGCGNIIESRDTNIRGGWAYTCSCGAHLFTFDGKLAMPRSLIVYIAYQKYGESSPLGVIKSIPHIEHFVGYSDYMDEIKKAVIIQLKSLGSIPIEECQDVDCKRERDRRMAMLQEAISEKDDYWRRFSDEKLASHFHISLVKVKEIRSNIQK